MEIILRGVWLFGVQSFAKVLQNFARQLVNLGFTVKLAPFQMGEVSNSIDSDRKWFLSLLDTPVSKDCLIYCYHIPTFFGSHSRFMQIYGRRTIGSTVFETASAPTFYTNGMNQLKALFVASTHNSQLALRAGIECPIETVPYGVDPNQYHPGVEPLKLEGAKDFVFLFNGHWQYRKGIDILLQAYLEEFNHDEPITLLLKTGFLQSQKLRNVAQTISEYKFCCKKKKQPHIMYSTTALEERDMPRLYAAADAFVMPTKGEAWGLPFMEAMSMELPTIGTKCSGQLDFMNETNSYLIPVEKIAKEPRINWIAPHYKDQDFYWPSMPELKKAMRTVYTNYDQAKAKAKKARQDIISKWTWEHAGFKLKQALENYS